MADTGYLIVTRPIFLDTLTCFIAWKKALGYTVYVKTAEEIEGEYSGQDIRFRIRNCIRDYYRNKNVQYVLMIGDSRDLPYPEGDQGPPAPSLSEPYELPAGYYRKDYRDKEGILKTFSLYSTLFYADLNDGIHISENEYFFPGNYRIYVGHIPVRTPAELDIVLKKTIKSEPTDKLSLIVSEDLFDPDYFPVYARQIGDMAGDLLSIAQFTLGESSPDQDVYNAIFSREGIIDSNGHGLMDPTNPNQRPGFRMGDVWIWKEDAGRFQYINPLYILSSCWGDSYIYGECIDESFLKAEKGPATMLTKSPDSGPGSSGAGMTQTEKDFWRSLIAGNPVGKAFYDNCTSVNVNPLKLIGDPSLVIVRPAHRYSDLIRGKKIYTLVASVWTFVAGALLFNPFGVFCIKCGGPVNAAGYIGDPVVTVLGLGLIAIGAYGIYATVRGPGKTAAIRDRPENTAGKNRR